MSNHVKGRTAKQRGNFSGRSAAPGAQIALLLLYSFGCGVGAALALLAVFAFALERFPIPLTLVGPMACVAAGAGAAVSGMGLAGRLGQKRLLCGLACGGFYAVCLALATLLRAGTLSLSGMSGTLLAVLLLGGALGGASTALRASGSARQR